MFPNPYSIWFQDQKITKTHKNDELKRGMIMNEVCKSFHAVEGLVGWLGCYSLQWLFRLNKQIPELPIIWWSMK